MRAKKSLGQHFLKSKEALREIVAAARLTKNDTVIEVGPGKGVLTEELLKEGNRVIALEKDNRLISFLQEKFQKEVTTGKLEIREIDALNYEISKEQSPGESYKIVANIPYYITGALLRKFLTAAHQPELMVLLVQKEVADRIVSRDGKESLLSLSVKAYGKPKYLQTVKAKYFSPAPKVDSAIILVDSISRKFFTSFSEKDFFELIHASFAHKRKQLAKNLKDSGFELGPILKVLDLPENIRAEDVPIEQWKKLAEGFATNQEKGGMYP